MGIIADNRAVVSVFEGALLMIIFCLGGVVATISLGTIMDILTDEAATQMVTFNVPEQWNTLDEMLWCVTDMHLLLIMFPILGILIFIVSVVHKTRYDQYGDSVLMSEDEYEDY